MAAVVAIAAMAMRTAADLTGQTENANRFLTADSLVQREIEIIRGAADQGAMLSEEGRKGMAAGGDGRGGDSSQHQSPTETADGGHNELEAVANVIGKGPEELLRFVWGGVMIEGTAC